MDRSKGKAGIKLKCISGNLCTKIIDKPMNKRSFFFNPQCNVTVLHLVLFTTIVWEKFMIGNIHRKKYS